MTEKEEKINMENVHHEEDATERSPLNGSGDAAGEKDVEANGGGDQKGGSAADEKDGASVQKAKLTAIAHARRWCDLLQQGDQKTRLWTAVGAGLLVLLILFLVWFCIFYDPYADPQYRYLRMIPKYSARKNTIKYVAGEDGDWYKIKQQIDAFLENYKTNNVLPDVLARRLKMDCNDYHKSDYNSSCYFNAEDIFNMCGYPSENQNYGYEEGSPCVFLQFNHVPNWVPEPIVNPANIGLPTHLA